VINLILSVLLAGTIVGTNHADRIEGTRHRETIWALGGDDVIIPGAGYDRIWCGAGYDVVRTHEVPEFDWYYACEQVRYLPP
jgi:hypothetical protein